jgi:hypothetical protein
MDSDNFYCRCLNREIFGFFYVNFCQLGKGPRGQLLEYFISVFAKLKI